MGAEHFDGNPFGTHPDCPCCAGRRGGSWSTLCDGCAMGALRGKWPHGCPGDERRDPEEVGRG